MLAVYLAALGFGVTVIGLLLVMGGGKDGDADHGDADHGDADHGDADHGDADHGDTEHAGATKGDVLRLGPASALLSVRFWTFFLAAFGGTGTLATLAGLSVILTFVAALATGGVVGVGAHALFRALQHDRVSGETDLTSLAGEEGAVTVAVRPGARGKVRIRRPSGVHEIVATSRDPQVLDVGAKVLVTEVRDGVADVTSADPSPRAGAQMQQYRNPERS